eukprot:4058941-Amphidinium_carterae.1
MSSCCEASVSVCACAEDNSPSEGTAPFRLNMLLSPLKFTGFSRCVSRSAGFPAEGPPGTRFLD